MSVVVIQLTDAKIKNDFKQLSETIIVLDLNNPQIHSYKVICN